MIYRANREGRTRLWRDDALEEARLDHEWDEFQRWSCYEDEFEPEELWVQCEHFPDYWISNKGRLWSTISNKFLRFQKNVQTGYAQTKIYDENGRKRWVYQHRLMLQGFVGNLYPKTKTIGRHLNDNRSDNRLCNLDWGDQSDNVADSRRNGRMFMRKIEIENAETGERLYFDSGRDAARYLGVSPAMIVHAANEKYSGRLARGHYVRYIEER